MSKLDDKLKSLTRDPRPSPPVRGVVFKDSDIPRAEIGDSGLLEYYGHVVENVSPRELEKQMDHIFQDRGTTFRKSIRRLQMMIDNVDIKSSSYFRYELVLDSDVIPHDEIAISFLFAPAGVGHKIKSVDLKGIIAFIFEYHGENYHYQIGVSKLFQYFSGPAYPGSGFDFNAKPKEP